MKIAKNYDHHWTGEVEEKQDKIFESTATNADIKQITMVIEELTAGSTFVAMLDVTPPHNVTSPARPCAVLDWCQRFPYRLICEIQFQVA